MKRLALLISSAVALCAAAAAPTGWYDAGPAARPFTRWWWLGSAVDTAGLTYNLEQFAQKGLGGVEITPIYGVQGNEAHDIQYLSPQWMQMLRHTTAEARRLGLEVNLNNGTGWPFGGPNVTTDISARKAIIEKWDYKNGDHIAILPADKRQRPVAKLQRVVAVQGDRRIDITSKVAPGGRLSWDAPKGNWTVYALFCGRTFQQVKRAAPGGEGLVLNHYDSLAVKQYLRRFDEAFKGNEDIIPPCFFNDSYEVYGSDWSDSMLNEFKKDHGYDLGLYIPELKEDDGSDRRARIISDYRHTLGRLLYENFTKVWTAWAHGHGAVIRNQSHGSPANLLDIYAAVDIPECESFGMSEFKIPGLVKNGPSRPNDGDPAVLKFASSAAHIAGLPLTSSETLTWLTEHFRTSLARCKPEIDQMLASGVNHLYFHGSPYSPKDAPFPGWLFYASINMSPTNSIWADADGFFNYITRCQAFLQAGRPDNDFLLYFPIEDIWHDHGGNPYMMLSIHGMDKTMPQVKQAVTDILAAGYDVDYVSDKLLNTLSIGADHRLMAKGGNSYRAVIVPAARLMPEATLRRLLNMAREGATVIFAGGLPQDVPGYSNLKKRRKEFKKLAKSLPEYSATPRVHPIGKGHIITGGDYAATLALSGSRPEPMRIENGLTMLRRANEAGGNNYFVAELGDHGVDGWVKLAVPSASVMIFDPMDGRSGLAQSRPTADGGTEVRLQLAPGQSALLKTFPTVVEAKPWTYYKAADHPIAINQNWKLSFPKSEPEIKEEFGINSVMPWTALANDSAKVNFGTGRYTVTFHLDNPGAADEWLLDLGDVRESARVTVNGADAGKAWCVPFRLYIGKFLKPGENTLTIDVTNLQANRIAQYERQGRKWRIFKDTNINSVTGQRDFSFAGWETVPSGLNSTVTLTPLKAS